VVNLRLDADDLSDMRLFPAERFVIDAQAAPDEVRDRLSSAVVHGRRVSLRRPEAVFTGTVGANSFQLRSVLGYRNSFVPTAHGSFATGSTGTRVDVRLRMFPAVAIFMAVWLSLAAAFFLVMVVIAVRNPSRSWLPLVGIAFFAFGYLLMNLSFSFEARRIRTNLVLLLSGTPVTDLPRTDVSWLSDFRVRNAELPERRFNRAFLVIYGISGALTVSTWFRTVGACSNLQYHHRNEYACPSEGRIALTWILGVVLVATVFASRVALHTRRRGAYIPLVLIVAVIGALAGWLITHHGQWGVPI
jgi:hypothetical protein